MGRRVASAAAVVAAGLALALSACGSSGPPKIYGPAFVNRAGLEDAIRDNVGQKFGVQVDQVACPIRPVKAGDEFDCAVSIPGQTVQMRVSQSNDGGVEFSDKQAVMKAQWVIDVVMRTLGDKGLLATQVDCGTAALVVREVGGTTDCQVAFADGSRRKAIVTFNDSRGAVTIRLASLT